jgi:5-methylcytosine-specific restriction endonuclease McrA
LIITGEKKTYINGHNGRKYADPKAYQKAWRDRNRKQLYKKKMDRYKMLRVRLITISGGKCSECGYLYTGKNAAAFHFHHRDKKEKDLNICQSLVNIAWEKIVTEVKKCDFLCANCHETKHSQPF